MKPMESFLNSCLAKMAGFGFFEVKIKYILGLMLV